MRKLRFWKTLSLLLCLSMCVGFFIPAAGASDFHPETLNGEDDTWSEYADLDYTGEQNGDFSSTDGDYYDSGFTNTADLDEEDADFSFDVGEDTNPADEDSEIEPVLVFFRIVPADAVVSVYPVPVDEMGMPLPEDDITSENLYVIEAQEDGSYLLLPGDYLMDVICEGYESILRFPICVGAEPLEICVEMSKLGEYDATEQIEDSEGAAPTRGENTSEDTAPTGDENTSEDAAIAGDESDSEDATTTGDESTSEDVTPTGDESAADDATPTGDKTTSENTTPMEDKTISGDATSVGNETASGDATPAGVETASGSTESMKSETNTEEAAATEEEKKPSESEDADKESSADDEAPTQTLSALSAELGEPEVLVIDSDILVDTNMIITEDRMLLVTGGTLRIMQGAALQNLGCTVVSGGELRVSEGAVLENNGYLEVNENGLLTVEDGAGYMAGEAAVLHLNMSIEGSAAMISGIDPALMEATLFVSDAGHLYDALQNCGYAFTTICMDDPSLMNGLEISTSEGNIAFSLR